MSTYRLHIPDLSCGHCVATTKAVLARVPTLSACAIDLPRQEATFSLGDPAQLSKALAQLEEAGYPAQLRSIDGEL